MNVTAGPRQSSKRIRLSSVAENERPRVSAPAGFCALPNFLGSDTRLSLRARGVLMYLFSFEQGHAVSVSDLVQAGTEGLDAVMTALRELVFYGLIKPIYVKARIPAELRMAVLRRDGFRCVHCDSTEDLTAGHIIPECLGGPTTFENLQCECRSCNSHRGARIGWPE